MNTEGFRKNLPGRYFNAGMAEQNIIGMASGMALSGMKVFVYSIVPFVTLRCFEQIKIDMCVHKADVTIVGVGGGLAYGSAGATHYSIEEVAALRALPNMKIVCPATPSETKILTQQVIDVGGPVYLRVGRGKEQDLPVHYELKLGQAAVMRAGTDVTIFTAGPIALEALKAAEFLGSKGISVEVINMHTVKPLDTEIVKNRSKTRKGIFTLEEHSSIGGLGGAVSEVLATVAPRNSKFKIFGIPDAWPKTVGSQDYLRKICGISASQVASDILAILSLDS